MKMFKLKALIISGMITIGAIAGIQGFAFAQINTSSSEFSVSFQKEKSAINGNIANIKVQGENIKYLKERYKSNKANRNEAAMAADKKEIIKAVADLRRDKAYLKADKMNLITQHNLAIKAREDAIKKDQSDLNASRKKLDNDLACGNESAASVSAREVAQNNKVLESDKAMLHKEELNKNTDIVAVNKEIRKVNGQFDAVLYAEDAVANTKNWMEK